MARKPRYSAKIGIIYDEEYKGVRASVGILQNEFCSGDPVADWESAIKYIKAIDNDVKIVPDESVDLFLTEENYGVLDGRLKKISDVGSRRIE